MYRLTKFETIKTIVELETQLKIKHICLSRLDRDILEEYLIELIILTTK